VNLLQRLLLVIRRAVEWGVALLLSWMVLLALVQLLLRWTLSIGMPWADLQLRQMVLWVGLLGGVLAAAEGRHIRIDMVEHYLGRRLRTIVGGVIMFVAAAGSFYLGYLSLRFIASECEAGLVLGRVLFGHSMPEWTAELIIPVGFFLMGIYFLASIPPKSRASSEHGQT